MAYFAACTVRAGYQPAVYDHTAADAGSQCHKDKGGIALAAALPHFSECSDIGVISHLYRYAAEFFHDLFYRCYSPAKIYSFINDPVLIHRTGYGNADTCYLFFCILLFLHLPVDAFRNIRQNVFPAVLRSGGNLPFIDHCAFHIENTHLYGSSSHVYPKYIFSHSFVPFPDLSIRFLLSSSPDSAAHGYTVPAPHYNPSSSDGDLRLPPRR